jgi:DNA helicase HerA-like ATPase
LIFNEASQVLLDQIETVIKLIRSKGIGIFFCTQNPMDIPQSVLGQLGMKVQHALRAFTAVDRKAIRQAAENYPETKFYKVEDDITELGIGEAFVTMLNEKGIPTPLVHTMLLPPRSRMDILTDEEIKTLVGKSKLAAKYNQAVDNQSAYEILTEKINQAEQRSEEVKQLQEQAKAEKKAAGREPKEKSILDNPIVRSAGRTAATMITRSLLGVLGLGGSTRRRSRSLF